MSNMEADNVRSRNAFTQLGLAMHGQPTPHPYFHRPLGTLLREGFEAGFVLEALEERSFPPENMGGTTSLSWDGRFPEIAPVFIPRRRSLPTSARLGPRVD